jgi:hypothetical protein
LEDPELLLLLLREDVLPELPEEFPPLKIFLRKLPVLLLVFLVLNLFELLKIELGLELL